MSVREPLGTWVSYTTEVQRADGAWVEYPGAQRRPEAELAAADARNITSMLGYPARVAQLMTESYRVSPGGSVTAVPPPMAAVVEAATPAAVPPAVADVGRLEFETVDFLLEEWRPMARGGRWRRIGDTTGYEAPGEADAAAQEAADKSGHRVRVMCRYQRVTVTAVAEPKQDAEPGLLL